MVKDPTEALRREMLANPDRARHLPLEKWDTDQVRDLFEVHSFLAPFVFVTRKKDGVKGVLEFTHSPRWYFNFTPDSVP
jgi:hypothetical protein